MRITKAAKNTIRGRDYRLMEKGTGEDEKARAAAVFYEKWQQAEHHPEYAEQKIIWKARLG